jgi:hypothetical protein
VSDCGLSNTCNAFDPEFPPHRATYDPARFSEYPPRGNIHPRHDPDLVHQDAASFLHPMLPPNYISEIPEPEGSVKEGFLLYPWQTPTRWTYPFAIQSQDDSRDNTIPPRDPNEHYGGIPDVADQECLRRADIPWRQKGGTKVYLKVLSIPDH